MRGDKLIERELKRHPHVEYEFQHRGRHPAVVLRLNGKERFVVYSNTRTDYRGERNKICQIRRTIRELEA